MVSAVYIQVLKLVKLVHGPAIDTPYPFRISMNDAVCEFFKSGRWNELNRSAFSSVKKLSSENLNFQHVPIREKIINHYQNIRLEVINRWRIDFVVDTLIFFDFLEIIKYEGVVLEIFEGFY